MNTIIQFLNEWGGGFQRWATSSLLQTTILFLALLAVDLLVRKHARATVRYAIWMLMLLKLALPVDFSLPTALVRLETSPPMVVQTSPVAVETRPETPRAMPQPVEFENFGLPDIGASAVITTAISKGTGLVEKPEAKVGVEKLSLGGALFGLWLMGALIGTGVVFGRILALRRLVKRAGLASNGVNEALQAAAGSVDLRKTIPVRIIAELQTPALAGLIRPVILLPPTVVAALSPQELQAVFVHELCHIRRRDVLVNCAQTALQIIHFFNPLVWWANARIRTLREEAVDEMALVSLGEASEVYPETLVHVARLAIAPTKFFPGAIGIMEKESGISTRVKRILSAPFPKSARISLRGALAILCLAAVLLPMAREQKGLERSERLRTPSVSEASRVNPLKDVTLEQLFARYEYFRENLSRDQSVLFTEITQRSGAYDFLVAKMKKAPGQPDTQEAILNRQKAARLIPSFGTQSEMAVPLLIVALDDVDAVRTAATHALGEIGTAAKNAVPALIEELQFRNRAAPQALLKIAPQSEDVLKALIAALLDSRKDQDSETLRHQVVMSFHIAKPKSEKLDEVLKGIAEGNESENLRQAARAVLLMPQPVSPQLRSLLMPGPFTKSDIPKLVQAIKDNPDNYPMARALTTLGPEAAALAVPILMDIVQNKKSIFNASPFQHLCLLGEFGTNATPAVPLLIRYAQSDDLPAATTSLRSLGQIGPAAISAKPFLLSIINDANPRLLYEAANALWQVDNSEINRVLPLFLAALNDNTRNIAFEISVLGQMGPQAKAAVPRLLELMQIKGDSRLSAASSLVKIQPDLTAQAIPVIIEELGNLNFYFRLAAAKTLGEIGSAAKAALPELKRLASSGQLEASEAAAEAVKKIEATLTEDPQSRLNVEANPLKDVPIEQLFARFKPGYEGLERNQAALAAEIKRRDGSYEFLCAQLKKNSAGKQGSLDRRQKAAYLIPLFGEGARSAVPILLAILEDGDEMREAAAKALGRLGVVAKDAVPALLEELNFQNKEAPAALMMIAPQSDKVQNALMKTLLDNQKDVNFRIKIPPALVSSTSPEVKALLQKLAESGPDTIRQSAQFALGTGTGTGTVRRSPWTTPGDYTEADIPMLLERLKEDPNKDRNHYFTALTLGMLGPEAAAQAAPIVIDILENKKPQQPASYVAALGHYGTNSIPAIPLLIKYAQENDSTPLVNNALSSLGNIGPAAISAKPLLLSLLSSPDRLRITAAIALWQVDSNELNHVLPTLLADISAARPQGLNHSITILGRMGPPAAAAVPRLLEIWESAGRDRFIAGAALIKIQPGLTSKILPEIISELKQADQFRRDIAGGLLGEIGPAAKGAMPQLTAMLKDSDPDVVRTATETIKKIESR